MYFIKYVLLIIVAFCLVSCGNPGSLTTNNIIVSNENEAKKSTEKEVDSVKKWQRVLKEQLGQKYVDSVISKDQKHLFVTTNESSEIVLSDYIIFDNAISFNMKIVSSFNGMMIQVYPMKNDKLIYLLYPIRHVETSEVAIYDYKFHHKILRYEYNYYDDFSFELDRNEKFFIFHQQKVELPDFSRSVAELSLIERLGKLLVEMRVSKDKQYAYVVDNIHRFNFNLYVLDVSRTNYVEKSIIGSIGKDEQFFAFDLPGDKVMIFTYYRYETEVTMHGIYDCKYGEFMGYASPETLKYVTYNDLFSAYLSNDGQKILFQGIYNKAYYIDISNIYRPQEVYQY